LRAKEFQGGHIRWTGGGKGNKMTTGLRGKKVAAVTAKTHWVKD